MFNTKFNINIQNAVQKCRKQLQNVNIVGVLCVFRGFGGFQADLVPTNVEQSPEGQNRVPTPGRFCSRGEQPVGPFRPGGSSEWELLWRTGAWGGGGWQEIDLFIKRPPGLPSLVSQLWHPEPLFSAGVWRSLRPTPLSWLFEELLRSMSLLLGGAAQCFLRAPERRCKPAWDPVSQCR